MFLRKTIEKQESRIDELSKEIVALLKSRRTPEGNIIVDDLTIETLRLVYLS